jgi:hypothetical protein
MSDYTSYLFARPSFLEGVARIFDFSGSLNKYNVSRTPAEADRVALANDWKAVGEDMRSAMMQMEQEIPSRS